MSSPGKMDFTIGELQLMHTSVKQTRADLEGLLSSGGENALGFSMSDQQRNNVVSNISTCNSILRKLRKVITAEGFPLAPPG